jgi:hypothetical protein
MTIDAQSSSPLDVNGKILNGGIFASGDSIVTEFSPKNRIRLTGNWCNDQPDNKRDTKCAGQFNLFHGPILLKNLFQWHFSGIVIAGSQRGA